MHITTFPTPKTNFPLQDFTVDDFKNWWVAEGMPIRPPFAKAVFFTEVAQALVLFRNGIFQVELYMVRPNTSAPTHTHDGVESCLMYLTGNLEFGDEKGEFLDLQPFQYPRADGAHTLLGVGRTISDTGHSLRCGKEGGAFLSFEKWTKGPPTSVAENWQGEPTGPNHAEVIANRK